MKEINYLPKKGTIGLVAPSFGCVIEPYNTRLKYAIKNFKKTGYKVYEGENIFLSKGHLRSNKARLCAKEFMSQYENPSIKAIISVGGGETMCEVLPFIDFKKIAKLPHKFFMGFSDNTNFTYSLTTISEVPTIYGPCAGSFAFYPFKFDTLDAIKLISGESHKTKGYPFWQRYKDESNTDPLACSNYSEPKIIKVYPKDTTFNLNGRLLGGCLDCLVTLCGTRFDKTKEYIEKYKDDGIIWFMESCDLNSIDIERALFQLKEAGWFKYAKGFIFGRPLHFKEKVMGLDHYKAVKEVLKPLKLPIAFDIDLGHFDPTMPLITGVVAKVFIKENNIFVEYDQ